MTERVSLIGKTFTRLTVVLPWRRDAHKKAQWIAECSCGEFVIVAEANLKNGRTKSCGCYRKGRTGRPGRDLLDLTFGRLKVISKAGRKGHNVWWKCLCTCGTEVTLPGSSLYGGQTTSCGCYKSEEISRLKTTHGKRHTSEYSSWLGMRERCYKSKSERYSNYGGRGIKVCDRWMESFENFYEDMGDCPEGMSLDRINVNGDYEPGNCRWATWKEQQRNKRNTVYVDFEGSKVPLADVSDLTGLDYKHLYYVFRKRGAAFCSFYVENFRQAL